MATRRKYKIPHYRDGGRVMQDERIADDEPADGFPTEILGTEAGLLHEHGERPAEPPAESSLATEPENPLMHALHAQTRAEELQREAAQRQVPPTSEIDRHIEKIPNLSEHKKQLLRQFPIILQDAAVGASFNRHYQAGLQAGLADDTPELDNFLIANVAREIESRRQLALAAESEDVAVKRLDAEAEAILAEQQPAPVAPPPRPAAPRRSMPMSAPVSRDVPMGSGERRQENTLRADEREIARVSFPHLPAPQAEYEYLKNKKKMFAMKADGRIQGDG